MARFPLFIDISSMTCLVFAGGKVALRKIETLLKYDARIQVVSAAVDPRIAGLLPADRIHLLDIRVPGEEMQKTGYSEKMQGENSPEYWLESADLVIASTNDREVNHYIAILCKERGIPVNVIDAPEECSFLFPSIVKKGEISIGINTDGQSPIVSKKVRQEIEKAVPDYYGEISSQLGHVKDHVKETFPEESHRRAVLKEVAEKAFSLKGPLTEEELEEIYRKIAE